MATLWKREKKLVPARVGQRATTVPRSQQRSWRGGRWRKSSHSADGECVTFAEVRGEVVLRNSKKPRAGWLVFQREALAALIAGSKAGEFDDLTA